MVEQRLVGEDKGPIQEKEKHIDFALHGTSLKLIRETLERPSVVTSANVQEVIVFTQALLGKLPLVIHEVDEIPVSLTKTDVGMVTYQLYMRRKRLPYHGRKKLHTKYSQEIWNVNMAFISAGGEVADNFKKFLSVYNLHPGMKTLDYKKDRKKRK